MAGQLIAIVNDDRTYRAFVETLLTEGGYRTLSMPIGAEDYAVIRKARPSLVLLYIPMESPESGWVLFKGLRLGWDTKNISVVVWIANPSFRKEKTAELREMHCKIVSKPHPPSDLLATIHSIIGPAVPGTETVVHRGYGT